MRLRKGLTCEALAKLTDLDKSFVYRVESGHSQPTALPLLNLAKALGVTSDWLLTGAEP